jgi:hypothetical protein
MNTVIVLNHYDKVKETLTEIINRVKTNKLFPVLTSDEYYNAIIEYLETEHLVLKDDYNIGSVGLKYVLIKEVNIEEVSKEVVEEYEHYFNL